ncbi:hypothetical protein HYZ05_02570 [Candidatus Daviesbacteria bacterium]|nr:hypothetical protein [Candidatus Daviesbacteria bacterium]
MIWKLKKRANVKSNRSKYSLFSKKILTASFILILATGFFLNYFGIFTVKTVNIKIEKIDCADEKSIKDSLALSGKNFFLINAKFLEENLKRQFICIKKVSLAKYIPDHVGLTVFGRDPYAVLINLRLKEATGSATPSADDFDLGEKFLVDEEGVIFSKNAPDAHLPKIYFSHQELSLGKKLQGEILRDALMIINKLKGFGIEIGNVSVLENKVLIVYSTPKIIFKLLDNLDIQLASLQLILEKAKIESNNLEFIDLRFDKPIVRFAPKK